MNRYHRHLKLSSDYVPVIDFSQWDVSNLRWEEFHKSLMLRELNNDKFVRLIHSLGMTSKWIEIFQTPPNQDGIIHSDNTENLEWAKIVFQYGAIGSKMRWWSSDNVKEFSTSLEQVPGNYNKSYRTDSHYHGQVLVAFPEESNLEYEAEIGISSLVNVGALHSSHNPTNETRFVVTVALFDFDYNRILWDDALNRMKDYLDE